MASPELPIDARTISRVNLIIGAISLLVGIAFLVGGGWWIHRNHLDEFVGLIAKSDTAEGTVIENRAIKVHPAPASRTLSYTCYRAIVTFSDGNERIVTLADQIAFNPPSFRVGQKVRILYEQQNPQHAMIDRGWRNFIIPAICLVFGGLTVLGGLQRIARPELVPPQPSNPSQ